MEKPFTKNVAFSLQKTKIFGGQGPDLPHGKGRKLRLEIFVTAR